MRKKKILVFIDWFTPGYKAGGPIESCANLVEHLKEEFDFSIVTRDTDYCETVPYPSVKSDDWNSMNGIRVYYFSAQNISLKNISKILQQEAYDKVYLNGIFSWYFTLLPLFLLKKRKSTVIVAARGMLAPSALRIKKTKKYFFLAAAKLIGVFNNVKFHATNEQEKTAIQSVFGSNTVIQVASNLPAKKMPDTCPPRGKQAGNLRLVSIARIAPEKNLRFALEVLKQVKTPVVFDIYGPIYNNSYWNECLELIGQMPPAIKVTYKGSLEKEQVGETLKHYHALLMPTLGENFGHIILQAMSNGCPVIISDQTMWKDLTKIHAGWDIALEHPAFIHVIERCTQMPPEEYNKWSQGAYQYAAHFINNETLIAGNRELFA